MEIVLDMDGLLADFFSAACAEFGRDSESVAQELRPGEWDDMVRVLADGQDGIFWARLSGHLFWSSIPRTPWMMGLIDVVEEVDPLWRLATHATRCGDSAMYCASGKAAWIEDKISPNFDRWYICQDKSALAKPGRLLIDDCDDNVRAWQEAGGAAILWPAIWNSRHDEADGDVLGIVREDLQKVLAQDERRLSLSDEVNQIMDSLPFEPRPASKPSNPKDGLGIRKVPMSVVPTPVMFEAALGMYEGALKYGRHNYREIGVRASVYYDATWRHLAAWWEGEDIDPDSGMHHVAKAITSLMVLRDAQMRDMCNDDRPPATRDFLQPLNAQAANLVERCEHARV